MSAVDDFLEGGPEAAGLGKAECDESVADGGEDITGDWGKGARTVSAHLSRPASCQGVGQDTHTRGVPSARGRAMVHAVSRAVHAPPVLSTGRVGVAAARRIRAALSGTRAHRGRA